MSTVSYPDEGNQRCFELEDQSFWFKSRNKLISYFVKKYAEKGSFIDVGGGNGFVARELQNLYFEEVCLVEPGLDGCKNAAQRGLRCIFNGLLQDYNPGEKFSNIGLFDVVEHVEDDVSFFKMISDRMNTSGKIFVTVPSYNWLWSSEDVEAGHFRRYTARSLANTAADAGLRVQYVTYFFFSLIPLILLLRSLPYRMGIIRRNTKSAEEHKQGIAGRFLEMLLGIEFILIKKLGRLGFGASLLCVLEKK